jgi:VanZ family protein
MDAALNVLFYVPLGAAGLLSLRRRWLGWSLALVVGCCLSGAVEWIQLWSTTRFGTYTDVFTNSAGTVIGAGVAHAAIRWGWFPGRAGADPASRWRLDSHAAPLLGSWIVWQMFPFIPAISLPRLLGLPGLIAPWSWTTLVECLLGFAVLRVSMGRTHWLWVAYAALPAQAFLVNRTLSLAAMSGAALGWIGTEWGQSWVRSKLGWVLPAWLVIEELRPFVLTQKQAFVWGPFQTWYDGYAGSYYALVFGKLFLYIAVVWSQRERGAGWARAVAVPAVIVVIGEWAQQYLQGRTPESTELVLVLAAGTLMALCSERRAQS